jgi:methionyl aminopeptidase
MAAHGARSGPILTYRYPGSVCLSVDDEVVHGIPGDRALREGELLTLDVALELDGYHADAATLRDVGAAVERVTEARGFHVVPELHGHGIGRAMHEDPAVYNWPAPDGDLVLREGLVFTIEPMIVAGNPADYLDRDGWTVRTRDRSRSAHEEHTVVVAPGGAQVLTA